jgi:hypothetical protein
MYSSLPPSDIAMPEVIEWDNYRDWMRTIRNATRFPEEYFSPYVLCGATAAK